MTPLFMRYAARELRAGIGGFYIFIICLMLGTAAIATVQSLAAGMMQSLHEDGRYILGGDLSLRSMYRAPDAAVADYLDANFETSHIVETMTMVRHGTGAAQQTVLAELKAVDRAYPLYGTLVTDPAVDLRHDGIFLEDALLTRLNVKTGDTVHIGDAAFVVRGRIVHEPDRISGTRFSIAPRVIMTKDGYDRAGFNRLEGSQTHHSIRIKTPAAQKIDDLHHIEDRLRNTFPQHDLRLRNFYRASPQIERMINRLTLFLTLVGLTTLLIGGVGISNAVKSFLDSKTATIATLKCLGASRQCVFRIYMTQIMLLATLGVFAGLGVAIAASHIGAGWLAAQFALSTPSGFYPAALLPAAFYGFLVTFVFSLWPLGRALRVTPADLFRDLVLPAHKTPDRKIILMMTVAALALAALVITTSYMPRFAVYFVIGSGIAFGALFALSVLLRHGLLRIPLPKRPEIRLAVVNLTRPGNSATGVVLSLGLGLCVLIAMATVEHNFSRLLHSDLSQKTPSFFFIDIQPQQKDAFLAALEPYDDNIAMTPAFRGRVVAVNGIPAEDALVDTNEEWIIRSDRGFTYTAQQPEHGRIVAGTWWPADYAGTPAISISLDVQRAFDIGIGDEITVNILGMEITARVMNIRDIEWSSFTMNFAITFAPGVLEDAPASYIATAITKPDEEIALQNILAAQFPNITIIRVRDALDTAQGIIRAVAQAVSISAAVTLLAGTLVLAAAIAAARSRHLYDAVILKVLGATRRRIMTTFLIEYMVLSFITVFIAAMLGVAAAWAVMRFILDLPWIFSWMPVVVTTLFCLFITLAAGFAGTFRILGKKPAKYLRN